MNAVSEHGSPATRAGLEAEQQLAAKVVQSQQVAVSSQTTPLPVMVIAEDAAARMERYAAESPTRSRQACEAGCAACCHIAVSLLPTEALWIAERLRATRSEAELQSLRARLRDVSARVSHMTIEQRSAARVPCALLGSAGECTIHPFRPLGCRGWTSFSREACDAALHSGIPGHETERDRVAMIAAAGVTEGLEHALRDLTLDASQYELHSAVLRALETPNAADRYSADEPVFADCARVRSETLR